jgi:WD40 repeat protein
VAFLSDNKQVVLGLYNKTVQLWDAATEAALQTLKGYSSSVTSVAFLLNSKQIVSGLYNKTVRL